jgi:hypothetical protein
MKKLLIALCLTGCAGRRVEVKPLPEITS